MFVEQELDIFCLQQYNNPIEIQFIFVQGPVGTYFSSIFQYGVGNFFLVMSIMTPQINYTFVGQTNMTIRIRGSYK